MDTILQLNLRALYDSHRAQYLAAIQSVLEASTFVGGETVARFEREFASWLGDGLHALGCANGTDAITIAALALQLPPGSEAIIPAMTFFATAEALLHAGLTVRLVDIDPRTALIDLTAMEAAITPRTRLLVPVHLYGQMPAMDRVREIADRKQCRVLEDASQAHGARWRGLPVGHWGDVATYSFYPGKNLGAFGDGGAIVTRDAALLDRCRLLGSHGGRRRGEHEVVAYNSRLDALQAAVLEVKLALVDGWNERRRAVAKAYHDELRDVDGLQLPWTPPEAKPVHHQYVVQLSRRDALADFLRARGIETSVHYPRAIHQLPALAGKMPGKFPVAEKLAAEGLSLPMCPTLTENQVGRIVDGIRAFFAKS